jgi:hypothetical protein
MSMTRTAKILIYLNLALSLAFAFWAMSWYYNHVDWTDAKTGEFSRRAERIKEFEAARNRADARFQSALAAVAQEEQRIPELEAWYKAELESLRAGTQAPRDPVFAGGELQVDAKGLPRMGPVQNAAKKEIAGLGSLEKLNKIYAQRHEAIQAVGQEIDKLLAQESALSFEIGDGKAAGLRAELAAQQSEVRKSQSEQEFLEPLLYNRLVELQILKKRHAALEARLKELSGVRVAQRP